MIDIFLNNFYRDPLEYLGPLRFIWDPLTNWDPPDLLGPPRLIWGPRTYLDPLD